MGAQKKSRLQHYITQYEMLNEQFIESTDTTVSVDVMDDQIPPYFYGSHYSTPLGCVLYYLIRKEPFTSLHICLQGNHFDVPDRLFYSLPVTTHSCLENIPEIKEVIPEFYSDDSYLVNMNKQSFGNLQVFSSFFFLIYSLVYQLIMYSYLVLLLNYYLVISNLLKVILQLLSYMIGLIY